MEPQVTILHERPAERYHDTSRSWRLLKRFLPLGLSFLAGGLAFYISFFESSSADPASNISSFESNLKAYIREAARQNLILSPPESSSFDMDAPRELRGELRLLKESMIKLEDYDNRELARLKVKYSVDQYNIQKGLSPLMYASEELDLLEKPDGWRRLNYFHLLVESLKNTIIAFVCTFLIAYILVIIFAFCWWFFIDRLRDVSKAIRGG
jgi:hypothetical protein